jgi:hypothetical protein
MDEIDGVGVPDHGSDPPLGGTTSTGAIFPDPHRNELRRWRK